MNYLIIHPARPLLPLIIQRWEIVCSLGSVIMRRHQIPEDLSRGTCLLPPASVVLPVRPPRQNVSTISTKTLAVTRLTWVGHIRGIEKAKESFSGKIHVWCCMM